MEGHCPVCEHPLQERPITQLLCGHSYHTQCFLTNLAVAENIWDVHCVTCHGGLLPDFEHEHQDVEEEEEEEQEENDDTGTYAAEEERLLNLYDTNETFRKDIKKYVVALRGAAKPCTAFRKLAATKKTELAPTWALIKAQYEGLYNVKKDELLHSQEYKAFRSSDTRITRLFTNLRQRYDLTGWGIRALRVKPGCKSIRRHYRWRDSPRYIIRSALRLRLSSS
jgi:hypothetical protein